MIRLQKKDSNKDISIVQSSKALNGEAVCCCCSGIRGYTQASEACDSCCKTERENFTHMKSAIEKS